MKDGSLELAHVRRELMLYLDELAADDPRRIWEDERRKGLSSDIDEVFHFFFDDYDFDEGAIGICLFDAREVAFVEAVKRALNAILEDIGDKGDDDFVQHPLWRNVTSAAREAKAQLGAARQ